MIEAKLSPGQLTPTDTPRKLKTILEFIPLYVQGREDEIEPIIVVQNGRTRNYFICSGNHRGAAAYICQKPINSRIVTEPADLKLIMHGIVAGMGSLKELEEACRREAEDRHYLSNGWTEYLRDIQEFD